MKEQDQMPLGVFIVKEPKELSSILVRFGTTRKGKNKEDELQEYTFHLPSPAADVVEFYNRLNEIPKDTRYLIASFNELDYWHDRKHIFATIEEINKYQL